MSAEGAGGGRIKGAGECMRVKVYGCPLCEEFDCCPEHCCDWDSKDDLDDSALGPEEACNVIRHDTVGDAPTGEATKPENDAARVMNTADRSLAVGSGLRGIRALRKR